MGAAGFWDDPEAAAKFNAEYARVGRKLETYHGHADPVQSAGILVCALSKFSAGMQICEHQLNRRHLPFRMNINRNTAAVVADRDRSIDMNDHVDFRAKSGQMFVN